ncbi:3',5'-cyclic AMP phosphodiesterase CpdA [Desulfatibacillum alkenivorans DSM 16219]|uniref:3',5'-cyclic AMP phosphodiesterase CpdA n=1 Tax=Desulfatibacillum alkenivorans DSM 16219 TaxID=1121393 RepID=A0A1M6FBW4_9BACT|nr:metallophosphoesterase [Desulfatibacillum alkenivorans]SHI95153.1 3',5'-cyclic AMP phosphodiesterase CpdA [Desulfatibacillum alkenivorans DSM 16219]
MKKMLHISDLHIGHKTSKWTNRARCNSLADWMVMHFDEGDDYVVIITGDLVDSAHKLDKHGVPIHYGKVEPILEKLRDHFHKVLVVPGNHDYRSKTPDGETYPSGRLHALFQKSFMEGRDGPLWVEACVDGMTFIGVNSMQARLDVLEGGAAEGEIGTGQLENLKAELDAAADRNEKVAVYLHHHPMGPDGTPLELRDAKEFKECIRAYNNVQAVLFGHNHLITPDLSFDRWAGSKELGVPFVFDAGSASLKNKWIFAKGYCIEMDPETNKYRGFRIKYQKEQAVLTQGKWMTVSMS